MHLRRIVALPILPIVTTDQQREWSVEWIFVWLMIEGGRGRIMARWFLRIGFGVYCRYFVVGSQHIEVGRWYDIELGPYRRFRRKGFAAFHRWNFDRSVWMSWYWFLTWFFWLRVTVVGWWDLVVFSSMTVVCLDRYRGAEHSSPPFEAQPGSAQP